mmetsp:Transcript_27375/g.78877  ORF Transcript_27375/g.78877 Transcript_27375/m.78877 type:complete len:372 (+) Transcript_27375:79-1194(+)|eukprot:CAMPEP_0168425006 /NCGR_PEP_ID=MMETSP0228-20121227/35107_1 /TAXON_ID=133427 /ORGANISM="Protoceratium reticulatum, Strain CCCM 535 (=CCMP 1889)" /LENGTH=371 /DNA_ID=CAMNT_0008438997 /DNA_START=30 /DNA_END=1145 /DNA_ORIENTATION=+
MHAPSHQLEVAGSDAEDLREGPPLPSQRMRHYGKFLSAAALLVAGTLLLSALTTSHRSSRSLAKPRGVAPGNLVGLAQQPGAAANRTKSNPHMQTAANHTTLDSRNRTAANHTKPNSRNGTAANRTKPHARSHIVSKNSLFCFALMLPFGTEQDLIRWQLAHHKGLFACEEWAVYSNKTFKLSKDVSTRVVHTSLDCPIGGQWNTRLNTPIFMKLWQQVFKDNQFRRAAWAVKVDPDTVFFADRIRGIVSTPAHDKAQEGAGMFSDNCQYTHSMHGPVELLSRRAVEVYGTKGERECDASILQEDYYMRSCLARRLWATHVDDFDLLAEQGCFWDWQSCTNGRAAFHPFKTVDAYSKCVWNAEQNGLTASI